MASKDELSTSDRASKDREHELQSANAELVRACSQLQREMEVRERDVQEAKV